MGFSSDNTLVSNQLSYNEFPDNFEEFHEMFDREFKKVSDSVNTKEGGLYVPEETATFQQYFNESDPQKNRNVYRKVINFGPLPNTTTKSVPHNIELTNASRITRLYGGATNPSTIEFYPLPFSSPTLANNVSLEANESLVTITTGIDLSNFVNVTVVMEYTKS